MNADQEIQRLSINDLIRRNEENLADITSCANQFRETKIRIAKLLKKCKRLAIKYDISQEHLKDLIRPDDFKEAEDDINKYFQSFHRTCSEPDDNLIKEKCGNDSDLIVLVKNALSYSSNQDGQYARPCLAVFGQIKAGKSSLVNSFLEEKIVIQRETRCTARMTYLSYCSQPFVAHILGDELKELRMNDRINEQEVELTSYDRTDSQKVKIEIRIGSTNRILKSGIDIIDSPGLNENIFLNDTCANIAKNFLPIMIYVIDGRKGITQEDISDIQEIQNENPDLKMIYFVTKLDRSQKERKRKPRDELEVAKERLDNAYDKLVKYKFLPSGVAREKCKDFHGASLWMVQNWQESMSSSSSIKNIDDNQSDNIKLAEEYNMTQFIKFQDCILEFVKENLNYKMIRAAEKLQITIEELIEKINNLIDRHTGDQKDINQSVTKFETIESDLFKSEYEHMENELNREISLLLEENQESFIQTLSECEFLGEQGFSHASINNPQYQRPEIFKQYQENIQKLLELELNKRIRKFVIDFMRKKQTRLKNELQKIVRDLAESSMGLTSFETMLQNRLLHEYEFHVKYMSDAVHRSSMSVFLRNIFRPVKNIFKQLRGPLPDNKLPTSKAWKEKCGKLLLERLDKKEFISKICTVIIDEFKQKHDRFVKQLNEQKRALEIKLQDVNQAKQKLKYFVDEFQLQFMHCFEVSSEFKIKKFDFDCSPAIGRGGEGEVRKFENLVAKKVLINGRFEEKRCAVEVYYASRLNQSRVLQLQGIHLINIDKFKKECILYYPFMSGGDLKSFIESRLLLLQERIQYAIEIAEGLMQLHRQSIVHRDIKLENILLRQTETGFEAVVADYGFIKHLIWIRCSKLGSLLHHAPEMLKREEYDHKVDIFSYGMLLWILISYRTENYNDYYPKMYYQNYDHPENIEKLIIKGERPEQRTTINDDLYDLMKSCWNENPKLRPSCEEIIEELKRQQLQIANN